MVRGETEQGGVTIGAGTKFRSLSAYRDDQVGSVRGPTLWRWLNGLMIASEKA